VNTSTSSLIHVLRIKLICTANIYGKDLVVQCLMLVENNKYLHGIQYIELLMGNCWLHDKYTMNLESKVLHYVTNPGRGMWLCILSLWVLELVS
jgi:hypothetical protein